MKLTTKLISSIYDAPLDSLKDINVSKKEIDSIGDITACKQTRKLNLSNNQLVDETSITGLRDLPHITLLNLSNNKLKNFTGLQHLQTLCGNLANVYKFN
jgi:Leucine-rich repeat (LRR) protein